MSKTPAATVTADRLRSFLERIEKLMEERDAIQSDIKDVFSEAKGVGYDVKTMRKILQMRRMDSADRAEQEALLDTYMVALGMTNGGAAREPSDDELEERAARIVTEVDMLMELVADDQPPSIAAIREATGCSLGKASRLRGLVQDRISRTNRVDREIESQKSSGQRVEADRAGVVAAAGAWPAASAGVAPGPLDTPDLGIPTSVSVDDDLAIPAHLDRRARA